MERAEFIVETPEWKSLYKMKYDGHKEKLLAFSALVLGTIRFKLGDLFPQLKSLVEGENIEEPEITAKEIKSKAKKIVKEAGIPKEYGGFAEMWVISELLSRVGLKTAPEKRELKSILKKI